MHDLLWDGGGNFSVDEFGAQAHTGFCFLTGADDFSVFVHGNGKAAFESGVWTKSSDHALQIFQFESSIQELPLNQLGKRALQFQSLRHSAVQNSAWMKIVMFDKELTIMLLASKER